ncbi:MAG: poly-gamma-glutamate system protein [Myxococcota bacterium]
MKALYWRSNYVSTPQLVAVAVLALAGLAYVERNPTTVHDPSYELKVQAARLAEQSFTAIGLERISRGISLNSESDPAGSGLIGPSHTPIVSNSGHLRAKQTTANPNFAAVFVEMLQEAGVGRGDVVAVNVTGSFPASNIAMYAALETLRAEPIVVSSVAASEYGASHPAMTWLDMERVLFERGLSSFRSVSATMGGVLDVAQNHTDEGRTLIRAAIARSDLPLVEPLDYDDAVRRRIALFDEVRRGRPIAAYINIGGGTASVGTRDDKHDYRPGLNTAVPRGLERRSVMRHYLEADVPVIHVSNIRAIARRYGLPDAPVATPAPGEGGVFAQAEVSPTRLVVLLFLLILAMLVATRFDLASVFSKRRGEKKGPEQMA